MPTQSHRKPTLGNAIKSVSIIPLKVQKNKLGFTVDISTITPQFLVCSYPVTKYPRLLYRNNLEDLVTHLTLHYGANAWKIYNFKVEHNFGDYTDEELLNLYNKVEFANRLTPPIDSMNNNNNNHNNNNNNNNNQSLISNDNGPMNELERLSNILLRESWLDHSPPPFLLLEFIVDDMNKHLQKDKGNVILAHCKMGKGRSGTVCIAFMMKYLFCPLSESREIFMCGRFKPGVSRGVTIYSQLRILKYHEQFLKFNSLQQEEILDEMRQCKIRLHWIKLINPLKIFFSQPYSVSIKFQEYNEKRDGLNIIEALETDRSLLDKQDQQEILLYLHEIILNTDIRLEFGIKNSKSKKKLKDGLAPTISSSHCWLNLFWETVNGIKDAEMLMTEGQGLIKHPEVEGKFFCHSMNWKELDGTIGSTNKGLCLFESMELCWKVL
ncbi:hypothetical protein TBLA_0B01210 [Henningerozyma blattae CBS 6284]|uniref:Uncharacterized protein n=1 Tax=Henningerozyma blattae (strain ATCC 34711 / CBS 6284 / DSM 70876 / NBRC 10599 / NRRL Y-10934 / UCD 77-7) TaxID=1071380 RepID=I2GXW2_HENB6|nr:hypothetical protein TBLA_0B01210 [Tetrapisispora blattae CBS 6284]CCH58964.1 hypothetical protein TBLA_0B01210 [Tetrapisispora blattae CBS 6284]